MSACVLVIRVSTYREKMHILHSDVGSNDTIVTISTLWNFMFFWISIALRYLANEGLWVVSRATHRGLKLVQYNFNFLYWSYDEIKHMRWIKLGSLARCSVSHQLPSSQHTLLMTRIPCFILTTLTLNKKYPSFSILILVDIFSWMDDTKVEPRYFVHYWSIIKVIYEWLLKY